MGPRKCYAPGCTTKYGEGFLSELSPQTHDMLQWIQAFPEEAREFIPNKCCAVCKVNQ